jgi:2-dehydropantoate 2-reductase
VTTRASTWKYLVDDGAARVLVKLIREIGTLAAACGVELTDQSMFPIATICSGTEQAAIEIILGYGAEYRANSPNHRMSTLQDLEAGRRLELDETFGFAARKAAELKLQLPLLETFYPVLRAIDRAQRLS